MKFIISILIFLLVVACSPQKIFVTVEVTRMVTQSEKIIQSETLIPTSNPKPTNTPIIFKSIIPTPTRWPTFTPGPTNTPGPTHTPTETIPPAFLTQTAQAAIDAILQADHEPGVYLVNIDIAPGIWRSTPGSDDCYWKRSDRTGDIIDNYYSFSGGTIYIASTDFSVELSEDCGIWTYLSPP